MRENWEPSTAGAWRSLRNLCFAATFMAVLFAAFYFRMVDGLFPLLAKASNSSWLAPNHNLAALVGMVVLISVLTFIRFGLLHWKPSRKDQQSSLLDDVFFRYDA